MADEKITIVDIRKAIARQMSLPSDTAGKFLNALFPAIIDGLKKDGMVRLSGLGCFKLVWVEPRKSVNVTTGESIVLEGYNKLTFIPDSYIREQINEPYAGLEAVRVDENGQPMEPQSTLPGLDPRVRFGEQAQEIVDLLADLGQDVTKLPEEPVEETESDLPQEESKEEAPREDVSSEEEAPAAEEDAQDEEPEVEEETTEEPGKDEEEAEEKPLEYLSDELLPIVEEVPAEEKTETPVDAPVEAPKKEEHLSSPSPFADDKKQDDDRGFNPWIRALITILILLIMLVIGYFVLVSKLENWANTLGVQTTETQEKQETEMPEDTIAMLDIEPLQPLEADSQPSQPAVEQSAPAHETAAEPAPILQDTDIIAMETVSPGSRLTLIARKYYGNKDLWVYIYEANRDVIKNPSVLTTGVKLKIPRLSEEAQNMSKEELKALHNKYIQ